MIGGISRVDNNHISYSSVEDPSEAEKEPIEARFDGIQTAEKNELKNRELSVDEEWKPNFDFAVKCLAEKNLRTIDVLILSKTASYVKDHFDFYLRQAEDVNALLEDCIPVLDSSKPVPNYALQQARSYLYKKMGPLLRFLNAAGRFKDYGELIHVALFGKASDGLGIKVASIKSQNRMDSLRFSVMSQLHIRFSDLKNNRQQERLEYYELFYARLSEMEGKVADIRAEYLYYAPDSIEVDYEAREIRLSTAAFQSIIYLSKKYFKCLFEYAIDREMEVRVLYMILEVVLGEKAFFFHVPDRPSIFVLKDAMQDVNEKLIERKDSCAGYLLGSTPIKTLFSNFVENTLFKADALMVMLGRDEFRLGGPENDFPIDRLKDYFLRSIKSIRPQDLIEKIKECGELSKVLGKKATLDKSDFSAFLRDAYEKYNCAKTASEGNFIIHRLNQICDGVVFDEKELNGLSDQLKMAIEFLFPLFLLQFLIMANDNFYDEFLRLYRGKKCIDGHCFEVSHTLDGLEGHKYAYFSDFLEGGVTGYSIIGTLSINAFWGECRIRMVPFKKIFFSPFISFDTFSRLSENIYLDINNEAFKMNIMEHFRSISNEIVKETLEKIDVLKERLREIMVVKSLLDDLGISPEFYKDELLLLKKLERPIREKMWVSRDLELSQYYHRMYSENGFLRTSH